MKKLPFVSTMIFTRLFIRSGLLFLVLILALTRQVDAQNEDTTPPQIESFSFSPAAINTASGSQIVTVTMRITDNLSGYQGALLRFNSPSKNQFQSTSFHSGTRISGDDKDGIYQSTITFPQYSESGVWTPSGYLYDAAGNTFEFNSSYLAASGFPANLYVVSPTAASVTVSGRVLTSYGRGISKAVVTSTNTNGEIRYALTNSFGYYRFESVSAGETYVFNVKNKSYGFIPQVYFIGSEQMDLNFTASP